MNNYLQSATVSFGRRRRRFASIIGHPRRAEIDRLLFDEHMPVTRVHMWITQECPDSSVSYVTLTRYRRHREMKERQCPETVGKSQVRDDVEVLDAVIERGAQSLQVGQTPSVSQLLKAIELRAQILAMCPEAGESEEDIRSEAHELIKCIADLCWEIMTEEQYAELQQRISEIWSADNA